MLHLNGQNLRPPAKNVCNSKTPGHHLSATHGKDAGGTAQLDLLLLKSPRPDLDREAESQPRRHPLKLAPLELPEEVREAQRQKLKFIQQEMTVNEPRTSKVKYCMRQGVVKSTVCPPTSKEPLKTQQQNRFSRPQLSHSNPTEQNADRHLEDMVCRGAPAPLCSKQAPLLLSPRVKARAECGREAACQNPSTLQWEAGRRRLRLGRAQCLEEDQCNSNTSTGGPSREKGKLALGVQGKGQRAGMAPRVQPHTGKGIDELSASSREHGSVTKSHQEECSQQSARCTLDRLLAEGGSGEHALDGVKLSAPNWRLKRKKPLITKQNNAVHLEHLQL
ncbi:hypothetical protein Q5P01_018006 [Channa striata]|uniref:Uncharacterized protein n=1 Tax=Channa striata TaxID=64152 RepID=A0AA88S7K7_CHASR|nr:hypothetical protein Q5P01_018006 [Channa striata]